MNYVVRAPGSSFLIIDDNPAGCGYRLDNRLVQQVTRFPSRRKAECWANKIRQKHSWGPGIIEVYKESECT